MKSAVWLKVTAAIAALQGVAHGALLLSYVPRHGNGETAVIELMRSQRFDFGGFAPHSYWEMYIGYGMFAALNCLIEAVLFWQLARIAQAGDRRWRPMATLFMIANLGYATLVALYFFRIPLVADLTVAACLGLALRRDL